ncbi:MAG: hypothetical protein PHF25_05145 [Candidatus Margulisbacteria bacterium]|nr:hypothetical protein [Candidatus Margulisiibacteriota bacterium]
MEPWIIKGPLIIILLILVFLFVGCIVQDVKAKRPFFLRIKDKE